MSEMPSRRWENLSADFCGPFPSGEYLLVVIDEYSRFPVVEIMKSTSANATIPVLDKIISSFGLPKVIKTDNGSPFNSHAFKEFSENTGFQHRRITPRWPRANSQAESFNKPLMKTIRAAHVERKNWKQEMFKFLRQYRNTAHASTGFPPFTLMFGRDTHTKLPEIPKSKLSAADECARQNDELAKRKMNSHTPSVSSSQKLERGDVVILRNEQRRDKTTPVFNPQPYKVVATKGNMISVSSKADNGKFVTRNASFFKRIPPHIAQSREEISEQDEIILEHPLSTETHNKPQAAGESESLQSTNNDPQISGDHANNTATSQHNTTSHASGYKTRSGRIVRKPAYLKDFV